MAHPARTAWLVVAGLVAFMLVLAGCGGGSDATSGGSSGEALQKLGKGEGEAQPDLLGRLRRTGMEQAVRTEDRLQGQQQGSRHLRRNGRADENRPVRRRLGLGQRHRAALVAAGLVAPVNADLVPNYKTVFADLKDQPYNTFEGVNYGIPHGRGANLLMWNGNDVKPGARLLGRDARPQGRGQVQGQDQPVRRPDVDRRSRGLPEVPRAGPGDRKPLRAERRTVRRGGRPAEGTAAATSANTGPKRPSRSPPSPAATTRSAPPGSTSTSR